MSSPLPPFPTPIRGGKGRREPGTGCKQSPLLFWSRSEQSPRQSAGRNRWFVVKVRVPHRVLVQLWRYFCPTTQFTRCLIDYSPAWTSLWPLSVNIDSLKFSIKSLRRDHRRRCSFLLTISQLMRDRSRCREFIILRGRHTCHNHFQGSQCFSCY